MKVHILNKYLLSYDTFVKGILIADENKYHFNHFEYNKIEF